MEERLVAYFLVSLKPVTVKFDVSCLFPVELIEIESQFFYPNSTRYKVVPKHEWIDPCLFNTTRRTRTIQRKFDGKRLSVLGVLLLNP